MGSRHRARNESWWVTWTNLRRPWHVTMGRNDPRGPRQHRSDPATSLDTPPVHHPRTRRNAPDRIDPPTHPGTGPSSAHLVELDSQPSDCLRWKPGAGLTAQLKQAAIPLRTIRVFVQ